MAGIKLGDTEIHKNRLFGFWRKLGPGRSDYLSAVARYIHKMIVFNLGDEQVEVEESLMKFRYGRGDIEDLAFGVLFSCHFCRKYAYP